MTLKLKIYKQYVALVAGRLQMLRQALKELSDSVADETKSTAGDKYETGRAMLHIEQDNVRKQMTDVLAQKAALEDVNPDSRMERVGVGSLVQTAEAYYFISAALGKIEVNGLTVFAVSPASPMGAALIGKKVGERVEMNGKDFLLRDVI